MTAATSDLAGEVCIVTGANAGLGREITGALLREGAHVIMACRDMDKCEAVRGELLKALNPPAQLHGPSTAGGQYPPGTATCQKLNLSDRASVEQFAAGFKRTEKRRLAVLVNNAGIMGSTGALEGADAHLRVNHLGTYLLTRLLLPAMLERPPGRSAARAPRIVTVASRAHYYGKLELTPSGDIAPGPSGWWGQYCRSKLCNVLMTAELQRRLAGRGISVYSVSPGLVATNLFSSLPWPLGPLCARIMPLVARTPAQGAEVAIYAAVSPELEGRSELFLHDCKPKQPSAAAQDPQLAAGLWEASERLIGPDKPHSRQTFF